MDVPITAHLLDQVKTRSAISITNRKNATVPVSRIL